MKKVKDKVDRNMDRFPETQDIEEYLTDKQLEQRTPIKRATYRKWRERGGKIGPPFYKFGRKVLYRWAEVEKWIASKRIGELTEQESFPDNYPENLDTIGKWVDDSLQLGRPMTLIDAVLQIPHIETTLEDGDWDEPRTRDEKNLQAGAFITICKALCTLMPDLATLDWRKE